MIDFIERNTDMCVLIFSLGAIEIAQISDFNFIFILFI